MARNHTRQPMRLGLVAGTGWICLALAAPATSAQPRDQGCVGMRIDQAGSLNCEHVPADTGTHPDQPTVFMPATSSAVVFGPALDIAGDTYIAYELRSGRLAASAPRKSSTFSGYVGAPLNAISISSNFGERFHPMLRMYRQHSGVDMAAPNGTSVFSAARGIVTMANWDGGYGLSVRVAHPGGLETRYAHLSAIHVRPGQSVETGDVIGRVGSTGLSTGPHLHFEVRVGGVPTNPGALVRSASRQRP